MAKRKLKLKKNAKIFILTFILIVPFLITSYIIIKPSDNKPLNNSSYEIISHLDLPINSKTPNINDFVKGKNINGTIAIYYDDWLVESDRLTEIGTYNVKLKLKEEINASIEVKDNEKPTLALNELTIKVGDNYDIESFVNSCNDNSNKKCIYAFKESNMKDFKEVGTYDIIIIASDESNNRVEASTKLTITDKEVNKVNNPQNNNYIKPIIEDIKKEEVKFGVKVTTTESVYYNINSDGSKEKIRSKVTNSYDREKYNFDINEFLQEARNLLEENKNDNELILDYLNEYRQNEKLAPLQISEKLNEAAEIRTLEIVWSGKYNHERPNGTYFHTITNDLNYNIKILGENIAKDKNTPKEVAEYWKESLGSYKNIIDSNYNYVGIGMVKENNITYWTLLFTGEV